MLESNTISVEGGYFGNVTEHKANVTWRGAVDMMCILSDNE